MFIATLSTTDKIWKQPKCPSTDDWIKKMLYTHTHTHHSEMKNNEVIPSVATWMDLEIIILSKMSQKEKDKYSMVSKKMIQMKLFTEKIQTQRTTYGYQRGKAGEGIN